MTSQRTVTFFPGDTTALGLRDQLILREMFWTSLTETGALYGVTP